MQHGWIMTGDQAVRDAEGYIRYLGRDDDMVSGAGYRIGAQNSRSLCSATRLSATLASFPLQTRPEAKWLRP